MTTYLWFDVIRVVYVLLFIPIFGLQKTKQGWHRTGRVRKRITEARFRIRSNHPMQRDVRLPPSWLSHL